VERPIAPPAGSASAELPIGGAADLPLAEALVRDGCPLCGLRENTARRYLESILWERSTDRGFRARLGTGRGFCAAHTREALAVDRRQGGGPLGASILFGYIVRDRLAELEGLSVTARRGSGRALEEAAAPADCPVCAEVAKVERSSTIRLLDRIADPAWAVALSDARLCLRDLLGIWTVANDRRAAEWPAVAEAQLRRVAELLARLEGFTAHSAYHLRAEMTDAERAAADDAVRFLAGSKDQR
jgi:hypothetical protein